MKLSIITVCYNSEKTILDTINSVNSQTYKNIEHIFVDGGSTDNTINLIKNNPNKKKILIQKKTSIYEAMNEGIKFSSGSIIQILNSDDILYSNTAIEKVIVKIKNFPNYNVYLGNVVFFSYNNFYKIKRYYSANHNRVINLSSGDMPPHPSSFIKKKIYDKYGMYNTEFNIASDYDFFLRVLFINKEKYKILNEDIVRMRSGGASDNNIKSYAKITYEIFKSLKQNKLKFSKLKIVMRGFGKIKELYKFDRKFQIFNFEYGKNRYDKNCFKILRSLSLLNLKKNFILSGMNLAFLGYYSKKNVYPHKNMYHWPDGIFLKNIVNINKIPGREIVKKIKLPRNIDKIHIIGNLSEKSKNYLKKKFNLKLFQTKLPYASIKKLAKFKLKLKKNTIAFITLPTPKQEQLAYHLAKKNKYYKIICIGGSISIASGEEKQVPKKFQDYEFLWRLNTDFFRRSKRLLESLYFYLKGKYLNNLYNLTIFKIIEKK
ncbi:glycosyltransferase [Candidatus Pelagibacter sp.]|nr:glycosyltransferase [Candidatus Pelagibacter sp.]